MSESITVSAKPVAAMSGGEGHGGAAASELAHLYGNGGSWLAVEGAPPPVRNLLGIAGLCRDNLLTLLDIAGGFKRDPHETPALLRGHTVVLYFNKPSTRTRISFETAVAQLGGTPLAVGPHELQLDRGETIEDTARVISSYARAFVIRTFSDEDVRRFAAAATIPVVNALTDMHHPCQVIGDLFTMRELWGGFAGRRLAFIGDGDNVAHSLIEGCALLGVDLAVACPPGYEPDASIVEAAKRVAAAAGSTVLITHNPLEAVAEADAVYTDVWLSMGVPELERAARVSAFREYQVNAALMSRAKPDAVFLHCLPAHRGEEVAADVFDGPHSRVFHQAANRLPTEQAILFALLTGRLSDASPNVPIAKEMP
jgi:ornithine carbamoyltransferase